MSYQEVGQLYLIVSLCVLWPTCVQLIGVLLGRCEVTSLFISLLVESTFTLTCIQSVGSFEHLCSFNPFTHIGHTQSLCHCPEWPRKQSDIQRGPYRSSPGVRYYSTGVEYPKGSSPPPTATLLCSSPLHFP